MAINDPLDPLNQESSFAQLVKQQTIAGPTVQAPTSSFAQLVSQQAPEQAPAPEPVQAPAPEPGISFFGGLKTLATEIIDAPENVLASAVTSVQGRSGADVVSPDIFERFSDRVRAENVARRLSVEKEFGDDSFLPGIKVKDVAGLAQNLGFSLTSLGTGVVTAAAGAVVAGTPGAVVAGLTGAGASAFRAASFDITKQFLETKNQELIETRGTGLTEEEQEQFREEFSSTATEFGLWEALPEAAGNILAFGIIGKPLSLIAGKLFGKKTAADVLAKFGGKFAGAKGFAAATAGELATEAVTEIGQAQTLKNTVLGSPDPLDWNISDFGTALKNVAPQTLLLMGVLKGGGAAVNKAVETAEYRKTKPEFKALQTAFPDQEFKRAGGGLYETKVGETTMKGSPRLLQAALSVTPTKQDQAVVENQVGELQAEALTIEEQLSREDLDVGTRANLESALDQNQEARRGLGDPATAEEPVVPPEPTVAQVKIQITNQDRKDLANLGFNGQDIKVMRPEEAGLLLETAQTLPENTKIVEDNGQFSLIDQETGEVIGGAFASKVEVVNQFTRPALPVEPAIPEPSLDRQTNYIFDQLSRGENPETVASFVGLPVKQVAEIFNVEVQRRSGTTVPAPQVPQVDPTPVEALQSRLNTYLAASGESVTVTGASAPVKLRSIISALEEAFGKTVHFYTQAGSESLRFDGVFFKEDPDNIFINVNTSGKIEAIIGHELVHVIRNDNPEIYQRLLDIVVSEDFLGSDAERVIDQYIRTLRDAQAAEGRPIDEANLRDEAVEELVADALGYHIMSGAFLNEVQATDQGLFDQLLDIIAEFLVKTKNTLSGQARSKVESIQEALDAELNLYQDDRNSLAARTDPETARALNQEFDVTARFKRRIDPLGFYSPLENQVGTLFDQPTLTGEQLLKKLEGAEPLIQREIDYLGLDNYLRLNKEVTLTQKQVEDFIASEGVRVEEVVQDGEGRRGISLFANKQELARVQVETDETINGDKIFSIAVPEEFTSTAQKNLVLDRLVRLAAEESATQISWAENEEIDKFMAALGKKHDSELGEIPIFEPTDLSEFSPEEIQAIEEAGGSETRVGTEKSLFLNGSLKEATALAGMPLFSRPSKIRDQINEKVIEGTKRNIEILRQAIKNPRNAKLRFFPTMLKAMQLPHIIEVFKGRLPGLEKLEGVVRKYTSTKDGIVTQAQTIFDALKDAIGTDGTLDRRVKQMMATASLYQVDPRKTLMEQDWIPAGTSGQAGLEAAERAWLAAGMPAQTDGKTFREAYEFSKSQYDPLKADIKKAYSDMVDNAKAIREREHSAAVAQVMELDIADPAKQQALLDQVDAMFATLKGAYLPLGRFGKYIVRVKDENGKVVYESHQESPERQFMEAKALESNLEEGQRVELDVKGDADFDSDKQVPESFAASIRELAQVKFMGNLDPESVEGQAAQQRMREFNEDLFQLWIRNSREGSGLKNSTKRKGTPGFEADMSRSYIDYMIKHAANVSYSEHGREINKIMNVMSLEVQGRIGDNDPEAMIDKVVLQGVRNHILTARETKTSTFAQMLGKGSLLWYLSSPSQFVVQLSQLGVLTLPHLGARFGLAKSGKALSTALQKALTPKRYSPAAITTVDEIYSRVNQPVTARMVAAAKAQEVENERMRDRGLQPSPEDIKATELAERTIGEPLLSREEQNQMLEDFIDGDSYTRDLLVLKYAIASNLLDITLTHEALEEAEGRDRGGWAKKFAFFIREAELASRKAATLGAFSLFQTEKNQNFLDAFDSAAKVNTTTLFDYSKEARAYFLRVNDWARVISQFQVFRISMAFQLGRLMHQSFKGMTPQERSVARKELAGILSVVSVLGGATALPFLTTFMAILEIVAGDDDEPILLWRDIRNALRNSIGDTGAELVLNGAPAALLGADISGRVGLDSIFEPSSGPPEYMNLAQTVNWGAANMLGPSYGMVHDLAKGADTINKGDYLKGISLMMPKLFRDPIKALDASLNGVRTAQGRSIMEEGALNPVEITLMAAGILPSDYAQASEASRDLSKVSQRISERRGELIRQFEQAYTAGDVEGREDALDEIKAFNEVQPKFPVNSGDLSTAIKRGIKNQKAILSVRELLLDRQFGIGVHKIEGQR